MTGFRNGLNVGCKEFFDRVDLRKKVSDNLFPWDAVANRRSGREGGARSGFGGHFRSRADSSHFPFVFLRTRSRVALPFFPACSALKPK